MRAPKNVSRSVSREARLAEKLRENLKRRKGKARAEQSARPDDCGPLASRAVTAHDDDGDGS